MSFECDNDTRCGPPVAVQRRTRPVASHEIGIVQERAERDGVVELTAWIPSEQRHQFERYRVAAPEAPAETA